MNLKLYVKYNVAEVSRNNLRFWQSTLETENFAFQMGSTKYMIFLSWKFYEV